jgi:cell division FtsZ-interacting protein ZapD
MLYNSEREADWATRATVSTLLEILAILSRGDVRSDVHKELDQQLDAVFPVTNLLSWHRQWRRKWLTSLLSRSGIWLLATGCIGRNSA